MSHYALDFPTTIDTDRAPLIDDGSHTGLDLASDFTIEFWYKETNSIDKTDMYLVSKSNTSQQSRQAYAVYLGNGNDEIWAWAASAGVFVAERNRKSWSLAGLDDGDWHHVAVTFDLANGDGSTQFELFLDGSSEGNGTTEGGRNDEVTSLWDTNSDFVIGGDTREGSAAQLLGARLFDVRVWSDIRSSGEISGNMLTRVSAASANLVGNWLTGSAEEHRSINSETVVDRTSNNNDLTIQDSGTGPYLNYVVDWPDDYEAPSESQVGAHDIVQRSVVTSDIDTNFDADNAAFSTGPDAVAPVIQNISPTPGTELAARDTPIEFDVIDVDPGLRMVVITLKYSALNETQVVFDGSQFVAPFNNAGSSMSAITNGYHFVVTPVRDWLSDIEELFVYAVDTVGNLEGLP